ncbi:MAG: hypothetical protein GX488_01500 [Clostridiales bacterium]|nr:hypothetical protein [Clostridiales bacterium]
MHQPIIASADDLEELVSKTISSLGIPSGLRGYHFIKSAELMILEDGNYIYKLADEVYPRIASKYFTTSRRVDRAIRYAIETSWVCESGNSLRCQYSNNALMPTDMEFFEFITKQINSCL